MNNLLDQLFRSKLEDHATPAPAAAWSRIEKQLAKKNNTPWLVRIAASILLVSVIGGSWLMNSRTADTKLQSAAPLAQKAETIKPSDAKPVAIEPAHQKENKKASKSATRENLVPDNRPSKEVPAVQNEVHQPIEPVVSDDVDPMISPVESQTTASHVASTTVTERKPIVLEYRLEEVKPAAIAGNDSKEKTTLSRVIDFARDAKNGDARFGELRQAKDELFAFNFKKEKSDTHK